MKNALLLLLLAALPCSALSTNQVGDFVAVATAGRCAPGVTFEETQILFRVETNRSVIAHLAVQGNVFETGTNRISVFGVTRGRTQAGFRFVVRITRAGIVRGLFTGPCAGTVAGQKQVWSE